MSQFEDVPSDNPDGEPSEAVDSTDSPTPQPKRKGGGALREVALIVVVALILSALVRTFLVQAFWIPSGSMENTLLPDDRVLVSKLTTRIGGIERGEVIVFKDPDNWLSPTLDDGSPLAQAVRKGLVFVGLAPSRSDRDLVKRVIGVGGDHVKCCDAQGRITVNGQPLDEKSYLYPGDKPSDEPFDVIVPEGKLWVMGDHRSASGDSRVHQGEPGGGFVPENDVVGRAAYVVWPFARWAGLPIPVTFTTIPAPAPTTTPTPKPAVTN